MPSSAVSSQTPVSALLLVAPGCPHCASMLEGLANLVKEGALGRLEVVNVAVEPDAARERGIRSVPWARIGPFELAGLHAPEELRHWTAQAAREEGMTVYLADLFATGRRALAADRIRREPALLPRLADLLGDSENGLSVRIGVMATLEELQNTGMLAGLHDRLAPLLAHPDARIRADACHALALTGSTEALALLQGCAGDPDPEVRETAREGVEQLRENRGA
jgi:thiol-disulfide isomerase/thioredoxin